MRVQSIPQLPHALDQLINRRISIRTSNNLPCRFPLAVTPRFRLEVVQQRNELVSQLVAERGEIIQRDVVLGCAESRSQAPTPAPHKAPRILFETVGRREQLLVLREQARRGTVELDGAAYEAAAELDELHDVARYTERG